MKFFPFTSYMSSEGNKNCPLCNSENYEQISNWDRRFKVLRQVKCENCAFVRHFPLPKSEQLSEYYSKNYRKDYQNVSQTPSERHIQNRKKGEAVSYGKAHILEQDSLIATAPIGYGDGYPWNSFPDGKVIVKNNFCKLIGRVTMDQIYLMLQDWMSILMMRLLF